MSNSIGSQISEQIPEQISDDVMQAIRGRKILVIGNGPSAISKKINTNNVLIARFNDYVTKGFEDVFSDRTDIWIVGDSIYNRLVKKKPNPNYLTIITVPLVKGYWKTQREQDNHKFTSENLPENTIVVHQKDMEFNESYKTSPLWASTGLMGLYHLKTYISDDIEAIGFDNFTSKSHYENGGMIHGGGHSTEIEASIMKSMQLKYRASREYSSAWRAEEKATILRCIP